MEKLSLRKNKYKFPLLAFIFMLLSIPLAVYALINLDSFDTRNRASTDIPTNLCVIRFPYINPSTIEQGKVVQVQVQANLIDEKISQVTILDRTGDIAFKKTYETNEQTSSISETFTFTSSSTGEYSLLGVVETDKGTQPCVIEGNRMITVVGNNSAPEFRTTPTSAKPGNVLKVKDSYEYLMQVEDVDGDTINYAFSFTPDANWLKHSVIEDGTNGKLTLKFTGIPDAPASYLANIFVHDGYNQHLRGQSWVINVDQDVNDVPKVTVYEPSKETSVKQGSTVKVSWEASDLNQITKYELFFSQNPGNQSTWIPINTNISNKVGHYIVDTGKLEVGKYQAIVRATDNFNPPAIGFGVSQSINITSSTDKPEQPNTPPKPDDGVILVDPQIINISPSKGSKLKNRKATVSATFIAGTGSEIEKTTVVVYVDDKDVTSDLKINEISPSEFSIVYATKSEYEIGNHSVNMRFKDTKGGLAQKDWIFEIIEDDSDSSSDTINIFGLQIPKRTAMIVGGGIIILLLAILVPWILYLLWRGSKDDEYETVYNNTYKTTTETKLNPSNEGGNDPFKDDRAPSPIFTDTASSVNTSMWTPPVYAEQEKVSPEITVDTATSTSPALEESPQVEEAVQEPTVVPTAVQDLPVQTPEITPEPEMPQTLDTAQQEFVPNIETDETNSPIVLEATENTDQPLEEQPLSDDILKLAESLNSLEENQPKDNSNNNPSQN